MFQLTVSVTSLDQLYTLSGHLAELGFLSEPAVEQRPPAPHADNKKGASELADAHRDGTAQLATDRQVSYMNDLALKAGWDLPTFEEAVIALFNLDDFSHLSRPMASDLITWLQQDDFIPRSRQ
ncbi:MAG: hypothetical protein R3A46_15035 [Thermomicrobiales bacterium]